MKKASSSWLWFSSSPWRTFHLSLFAKGSLENLKHPKKIGSPLPKGAVKKLKIRSFRQRACAGAPAPPGGTRAPRAFSAVGPEAVVRRNRSIQFFRSPNVGERSGVRGPSRPMKLARVLRVPRSATEIGSLRPNGSCEKIQNSLKTRREGTPPPLIRRELQPLLEARCPHRANFLTAPRGRGAGGVRGI